MNANFANIMPQVIARWCEEEGHAVSFLCYTGNEVLTEDIFDKPDIVFIGAVTESAQFAYALSNLFRAKGAVTALGGPHARCYPQDASRYFDYVLGFTDRTVIGDVLQDCSQHRPCGICLSADHNPEALPGVRERWKFIEPTLRKAPFVKVVPMIGSLGCPYSCGFCIDSTTKYQPLRLEQLKDDLRFLLTKFRRPRVSWHDPNFGVRLDEYLDAIEDAVPSNSFDFIAESSLSFLTEQRLRRMNRSGFKVILPGIESWYDLGNKTGTGSLTGINKVKKVSEHINMILRYIPYSHANLVFGLDTDEGPEPFELTKRFIDITPGAFPAFTLLTAFGEAAPINLHYQRSNRLMPFPFHLLGNKLSMNVRPKNYSWPEFFTHLISLTDYAFSHTQIMRRLRNNSFGISSAISWFKSVSGERGYLRYYRAIQSLLLCDRHFRRFFEQETNEIPSFFVSLIRRDLGPFWKWLPTGALTHDQHAFLKSSDRSQVE
jgi:hypothetical protein